MELLWHALLHSFVVVYKGAKPYEIVKLPHDASLLYAQLSALDADPQVIALLSAHPMDDIIGYETLLYPKAKDKTVDYVITNHTKFFKRMPAHLQFTEHPIKKLMMPR
jgi:hypothetical protein